MKTLLCLALVIAGALAFAQAVDTYGPARIAKGAESAAAHIHKAEAKARKAVRTFTEE